MKNYLKKRFGISFPPYLIIEKRGKRYIAYNKEINYNGKEDTRGIIVGKETALGFKPSTEFLQMYGYGTRNIVFINHLNDVKRIMKGEEIEVENTYATNGYVIIMFNHTIIGCGLLKDKKLINQIPKSKRVF